MVTPVVLAQGQTGSDAQRKRQAFGDQPETHDETLRDTQEMQREMHLKNVLTEFTDLTDLTYHVSVLERFDEVQIGQKVANRLPLQTKRN